MKEPNKIIKIIGRKNDVNNTAALEINILFINLHIGKKFFLKYKIFSSKNIPKI
jgi:hypothetical protein